MAIENAPERPAARESQETPSRPADQPSVTSVADVREQTNAATSERVIATRQMEDEGKLPKLTLSQPAISVESTLVNRALSGYSPDIATLGRVLQPMSSEDRKNLETDYKGRYGREFRDDLKAKLSPTDYAAQVAILDRKDGKTNLLGAVGVALETTRVDSVEGQKLLRATLETLDGKRLAGLDAESRRTTGKGFLQTIVDDPSVSKENKDIIRTMALGSQPRLAGAREEGVELDGKRYAVSGTDRRTSQDVVAMANSALQAKDLRMFKDVVGDESPAAQAALKLMQRDTAFTARFQETFQNGRSASERQVAEDIRTEGRVSLATIVQGNSNVWLGLLDNPGNTDLALSNATARERRDYTAGRELVRQAEKAGTTPEQLARTPEQQDQLAYTRKIDAGFDKTLARWDDGYGILGENERKIKDDQRRKSIWQDQLEHGGKTLISQLAQTEVRDSSQHTTDQLMGITERMSREDYTRLHGNPAELEKYTAQLSRSLDSYATPIERQRILDMVAAKANAPTYESSLGIKRSVTDVMADNTNTHWFGRADTYNNDKVVERLASMSPTDAQRYKNNTDGFRDTVDKFVREQLTEPSAQRYLADSTLRQVATTGKPPVLDAVQQVLNNKLSGADSATQVRDLEKVLQDKTTVAKLKQVEEAAALGGGEVFRRMQADPSFAESFKLAGALKESVPGVSNPMSWRMALEDGKIPPGIKFSMGVPITGLYEDFAKGPQERRDNVGFSADQRQILDSVVKQGGKLSLADEMRSFVIGDGAKFQDFKDRLGQLTLSDREKLKSEYADKYKSSLDNDFLSRVDKPRQLEYTNLLSASTRDGVQDFVDRTKLAAVTGSSADASSFTLERSVQQNQSVLAEFAKMREKLPEEKQKMLDQFFSEAKLQAVQSETAKAELIYNATVAAAILISIPATAGLSAGALAALVPLAATGGAAYRVGLMKAVQGGDFDSSTRNLVNQAVIGGLDALLVVAPGAIIGRGAKGAAELAPATRAELQAFLKEVKGGAGVTGSELVPAAGRAVVPAASGEVAAAGGTRGLPSLPGRAVSRSAEGSKVLEGEIIPPVKPLRLETGPRPSITIEGTATRVEAEAGRELAPTTGRAVVPAARSSEVATTGTRGLPSVPGRAVGRTTEGSRVLEGEIIPPVKPLRLEAGPRPFITIEGVATRVESEAAREAGSVTRGIRVSEALARPVLSAAGIVAAHRMEGSEQRTEARAPISDAKTAQPYKPNDAVVQAATVRRGEGPWQSAERILKTDGQKHTLEEVRALTKAIQQVYGNNAANPDMKSLKVKHNFVTETAQAYDSLIKAVKDERVRTLLIKMSSST